jgi:predicted nucleotidyltransferase
MLNDISSWKKTRITANYPDQSRTMEEVIKPQSVIDKIVEDSYEDGAVSVTVEQINEDAGVPDNKAFGRHG